MFQGTCEYCGVEFTAVRKRRCCTRQHSTYLSKQLQGKLPWQDAELELLHDLAGSAPEPLIVRRIRALDKKMGWPVRSPVAIQVKLKRLGLGRTCQYDNLTPTGIAKILAIPRDRVELWVERYGPPARKILKNKYSVTQAAFTRWVRQNPHLLANVDSDGLFGLTNLPNAREIAEQKPPRQGRPQPVQRLDTYQIFPSIKAAARTCFLHPASIRRALLDPNRATCDGARWKYLD